MFASAAVQPPPADRARDPATRRPAPSHTRCTRWAAAAVALAAAALLLVPSVAQGQGGTWGSVFPGAAAIGSPGWVTPGTRVVYYVASASVAQSRYQWIEDSNGDWTDPKTGKSYRRTDESGEGVGTGSGDGYSVIDFVAGDGGQVVTAVSLYVIDHAAGTLTYVPIGGGSEPAGAVDAVLLHPDILRGLEANGMDGVQVLRGAYPLGGTSYDATSLLSASQSVTFDRATGVVLVSTGNAMGASLPVHAPGEDPPLGNSMLTYQQLLGTRARTTPGIGAAVPAWLRPGLQLTYTGTWTTMGVPLPAQTTLSYSQVGDTWAALGVRVDISGGGLTSSNVTTAVSGGTGPFWYDPAALAGMTVGQVLDDDPLLGVRTSVTQIDPWSGGEEVWLLTEGPGTRLWFGYDRATGVPMAYQLDQAGSSISVGLTAMP